MKTIYIFSNWYPYGEVVESFLTDELLVASRIPDHYIELIPLHKNEYKRDLPSNIVLNTTLTNTLLMQKMRVFLLMLMNRYFWQLPFQGKYSPKSLSDYFQAVKYLYGSFLIKNFLLKNKTHFTEGAIFYSYWFNHTALGFCMAKETCHLFEKITMYTRAHGFDVYEKNVGTYIPYRNKVLSMINNVFVVSNKGASFLKQMYPIFAKKIEVSKLGVFSNLQKGYLEKRWDISILSCSNIIPIKRVDLIFDSINNFCKKHQQLKVKWTHIGGGEGLNMLQDMVKSKSCNIDVKLVGRIDRKRVLDIYRSECFNIFMNLSLTEGIPVSIMEAISCGITVLATDVGGNSEIATKDTGLLLPVSFTQQQFDTSVLYLTKNNEKLSRSTLEFYNKNYNAEINYNNFYINQLK